MQFGRMTRLTDRAIRRAIHDELLPPFLMCGHALIVDEMAVCGGDSRVDLAVINGQVHGFEIKSEADTLERLGKQSESYNRVFDTMTIICGEKHTQKVLSAVPEWWGVCTARIHFGRVQLTRLRFSEANLNVDRYYLAQMLWKDELTRLLAEVGIVKGVSSKPCRKLWNLVSEAFTTSELQSRVRHILKSRQCWRLPLTQM